MSDVLRPSRRARAIEPTMIRSLRAQMTPTTIDFGLGQTDLEVTPAVREQLRRRADGPMRTPYTPNAGAPEARRAVARHVGVGADEVMLTCGVQEGLAVAMLGLCDPGDEVLVPDPGFPAYANLVRAAGARPVPYPLGPPTADASRWTLEPQSVIDRLGDRTRLMVLNNPSNPTGTIHRRQALTEVLEQLAERGIGWVSDEIYEDYVWEGQFVSARHIDSGADGLVLSGLSKSHHLMGWRLGWMVGPADVITALTPLHQHLVTCAPRPAQMAAVAALEGHDEAFAETEQVFARRRRRVLEELQGINGHHPPVAEGAFYLFLDLRPWLQTFDSTLDLAKALLREEDVLAIPGEGFGDAGLGHLRIAYTIGGDELERGLRRVRQFLQRHRPK